MVKRVVNCIYAHKTNIAELLSCIRDMAWRERVALCVFEYHAVYDVVKYDTKKHMLSFIQSPDWDVANEPIVGDSVVFDLTRGTHLTAMPSKVVKCCKNPKIYHNKWQFVASDYKGFDIEAAKQRTVLWNSIPELRENKSRIGNRDYWFSMLDKYGINR